MSMRLCGGILAAAAVLCCLGESRADDDPKAVAAAAEQLRAVVRADATPPLVEQIAAKDAAAGDLGKVLATHPEVVEPVVDAALKGATTIARRDGAKALAFAEWLEGLAHDLRKAAPKDLSACRALRDAHLLRCRVASALVIPVPATPWIEAADLAVDCADMEKPGAVGDEAWMQALSILEEGTRGEKAATLALLDHAAVICSRAVKDREVSEPLRRAVAASYELQADSLHETSRKRAQSALSGYFETFHPMAHAERADKKDRRAWNRRVSFARELKIDVKADYVGYIGSGAGGLMSYLVPDTGRWTMDGGTITQVFPSKQLFRLIWFDTYDWDSVYRMPRSARTVGGDNVKGVAGRNFDTTLDACKEKNRKVKKTQKPKRTQWNKTLPAGIEYVIEYEDTDGLLTRERSFLVKAVKAEKTIQIIILEAVALTEYDPEYEAILESFDITKKTR